MLALLCACGDRVEAADGAALRSLIQAHLSHGHPQLTPLNDEEAHRVVGTYAYETTWAAGPGPTLTSRVVALFQPALHKAGAEGSQLLRPF